MNIVQVCFETSPIWNTYVVQGGGFTDEAPVHVRWCVAYRGDAHHPVHIADNAGKKNNFRNTAQISLHLITCYPVRGKSVRSWCDGLSDRSFMVDPLGYFSFQPVLHDWCNKGSGMCYPVCGMVHIK